MMPPLARLMLSVDVVWGMGGWRGTRLRSDQRKILVVVPILSFDTIALNVKPALSTSVSFV